MFYKEQPLIFGWFEYLNNIDVNENITKSEMEKTRNQLQIHNYSSKKTFKNADEMKQIMEAQEAVIDAKMTQLAKEIENAASIGT